MTSALARVTMRVDGGTVTVDGPLPPTRTHKARRSFKAVSPARQETTGMKWLARVEITQSGRTEVYLFDEIEPRHLPEGFRRFMLSNQSSQPTPDRPGLYEIIVSTRREAVKCTCTGSVTGLQAKRPATTANELDDVTRDAASCKHKDVVDALFAAKFFHPEEITDRDERTEEAEAPNLFREDA